MLIGVDAFGKFHTTPAAKYPQGLCEAIADCFFTTWLAVRAKGFERPRAPKRVTDSFTNPWGQQLHGRWKWVEPSPGFLAQLIEAINCGEIHSGVGTPQQ